MHLHSFADFFAKVHDIFGFLQFCGTLSILALFSGSFEKHISTLVFFCKGLEKAKVKRHVKWIWSFYKYKIIAYNAMHGHPTVKATI